MSKPRSGPSAVPRASKMTSVEIVGVFHAASAVRSTFSKHGGNLAQPGALQHTFSRQGQFLIGADKTTEEDLMELALEAGAEDIINNEDHFEVRCALADFDALSKAFEDAELTPDSSELAYIPNTLTPIADADAVKKFLRLTEALDDLEDAQNVYDNSEISPDLLPED